MNKNLLIPTSKELQERANIILNSNKMTPLKPQQFNYNVKKAEEEGTAFEPGPGINNYDRIGMLGLPVFDTVKLTCPDFKDNSGSPVPSQSFILDIALIEVTNERHIVTTEIAGRNGSIKEYMSDGDAKINIKGSLVSEVATFSPYVLIKDLSFIASCPVSLHVESNFLSYMKIFELVITQVKYSQQEGMRNVVSYELECISDTPFELKNA